MTRRWLARLNAHPRGRDAVIAATWLVLGLALIQFDGVHLWRGTTVFRTDGLIYLLTLLAMVALATQRSSRPMTTLACGVVVTVIDVLFGGSLGVVLVLTDLIYAAFKYGSDRGVRILLGCMVVAAAVVVVIFIVRSPVSVGLQVLTAQWALIIVVASVWGWNVRSERLRTSASMAREHAHATQQLRRRIAHDLHDLVANQIAVAGLHVEAAKLQLEHANVTAPAVDRSLDQAGRGTEQADQQLRRMITVLNAIDDLDEQPDATVEQLLATFFDELGILLPADRRVEWTGTGTTGLRIRLAAEPLPHVRVLLRVLLELLTNASRHGRGDVLVHVASAEHLTVEVTNAVAPSTLSRRGSGIGISGAALLLEGTGSTVESHRCDDTDGWLARLSIPPSGTRT